MREEFSFVLRRGAFARCVAGARRKGRTGIRVSDEAAGEFRTDGQIELKTHAAR